MVLEETSYDGMMVEPNNGGTDQTSSDETMVESNDGLIKQTATEQWGFRGG